MAGLAAHAALLTECLAEARVRVEVGDRSEAKTREHSNTLVVAVRHPGQHLLDAELATTELENGTDRSSRNALTGGVESQPVPETPPRWLAVEEADEARE